MSGRAKLTFMVISDTFKVVHVGDRDETEAFLANAAMTTPPGTFSVYKVEPVHYQVAVNVITQDPKMTDIPAEAVSGLAVIDRANGN